MLWLLAARKKKLLLRQPKLRLLLLRLLRPQLRQLLRLLTPPLLRPLMLLLRPLLPRLLTLPLRPLLLRLQKLLHPSNLRITEIKSRPLIRSAFLFGPLHHNNQSCDDNSIQSNPSS